MSRRRKQSLSERFSLNRESSHGIFTIVLFVLGTLLLLAIFDLAGRFGVAIDDAAAHIFGWDRIVLPFIIFAIAIHELSPERLELTIKNYIGFLLLYLSLNPFVQVVSFGSTSSLEETAKSGGKIGLLLAEPFAGFLGRIGAGVLFGALALVALLLIFNTSLRRLVEIGSLVFSMFSRVLWVIVSPVRSLLSRQSNRRDERVRSQFFNAAPITPKPVTAEEMERVEEESEERPEERSSHVGARTPVQTKKRRARIEVPLELLSQRDQKPTSGDIQHNQYIIQRTLETFGILVEMGDVAVGPTVTQFTLKPSEGVKLIKITALHNDLALALAAHPIRIEAPIPGKSLVGVEVPNQSVATVGLRELFESKEWQSAHPPLAFGLGRDVSGKPWTCDIAKTPHLMVAGATGSGKSVCLNTLILSLIYSNGPDELKLILVDPKRVELQVYNGIPHLVTPVITDVEKTVNALKWSLREMERRFDLLSAFGARDILSYNERAEEKIPYLCIVIDELADLMITAMQEVEGPIVRLAQMARAVGIHLILATQRPSVDVLTGLIKANIPARIAFAVASSTDSRTILDSPGAEKLLGRGDMLYQTSEMSSPKRVQGAFVSDEEIRRVVDFLKSKYEPTEYDAAVIERAKGNTARGGGGIVDEDSDPLLPEAREEILRAGKASASLLQRRLKVGYARAARLLDLLEQEGFIGPGDGAKPREILKADFTSGMDQIPTMESHPALDQVNAEIPEIEPIEEET